MIQLEDKNKILEFAMGYGSRTEIVKKYKVELDRLSDLIKEELELINNLKDVEELYLADLQKKYNLTREQLIKEIQKIVTLHE